MKSSRCTAEKTSTKTQTCICTVKKGTSIKTTRHWCDVSDIRPVMCFWEGLLNCRMKVLQETEIRWQFRCFAKRRKRDTSWYIPAGRTTRPTSSWIRIMTLDCMDVFKIFGEFQRNSPVNCEPWQYPHQSRYMYRVKRKWFWVNERKNPQGCL